MSGVDPQHIGTIQDAVNDLEFVGVENYQLAAHRNEDAEGPVNDGVGDEADVSTSIAYRTTAHGVDYRCQLTVNFAQGTIRVDSAAIFRSSQPVELAPGVVAQFGQDVAIMALYPYLRQTVADLGARLGFQTELPLLRRGAFTFTFDESAEPEAP